MYIFIFILLLFSALCELFNKPNKIISNGIFFLLLLLVSFRYGQGTDYFGYFAFFESAANSFENALIFNDIRYVYKEVGFAAISYFWFRTLQLSPESLTAVFSAVSFILSWLFINKYSVRPLVSLFIFYCTFYLVYPFSGIRQAVIISIFIYFMIPLLYKGRYLAFYLLATLLFFVHYSSVVLMIVPLVNLVKEYNPFQVFIISLISLVVGLVFYEFLFSLFSTIDVIGQKVDGYSNSESFSLISVLLRIFIMVPVMLTYQYIRRNSIRDTFLKIYILGFLLYLIFMSSSLISSRLNVYMRYLEVILLADFLVIYSRNFHDRVLIISYVFSILTILYIKNINSFIGQGSYYDNIKFYNYPYVSIFNKEKITEIREINTYYYPYIPN